MELKTYNKICSICHNTFITKYKNKNSCSFGCKQEAQRCRSREIMRKKRNIDSQNIKPCELCGYNLTTDIHHEGKETIVLCPNCHALITRNIKSLKELKKSTDYTQ